MGWRRGLLSCQTLEKTTNAEDSALLSFLFFFFSLCFACFFFFSPLRSPSLARRRDQRRGGVLACSRRRKARLIMTLCATAFLYRLFVFVCFFSLLLFASRLYIFFFSSRHAIFCLFWSLTWFRLSVCCAGVGSWIFVWQSLRLWETNAGTLEFTRLRGGPGLPLTSAQYHSISKPLPFYTVTLLSSQTQLQLASDFLTALMYCKDITMPLKQYVITFCFSVSWAMRGSAVILNIIMDMMS